MRTYVEDSGPRSFRVASRLAAVKEGFAGKRGANPRSPARN